MNEGFQQLFKQAQQFQENLQKAQAEMLQVHATGESGAGMVKVTLNGSFEALKVSLEPQLMQDSPEVIEELIASAITAAAQKVKSASQQKVRDMAGNMNLPTDFLPPDFKMPF